MHIRITTRCTKAGEWTHRKKNTLKDEERMPERNTTKKGVNFWRKVTHICVAESGFAAQRKARSGCGVFHELLRPYRSLYSIINYFREKSARRVLANRKCDNKGTCLLGQHQGVPMGLGGGLIDCVFSMS